MKDGSARVGLLSATLIDSSIRRRSPVRFQKRELPSPIEAFPGSIRCPGLGKHDRPTFIAAEMLAYL
jgi:hypothetical protein